MKTPEPRPTLYVAQKRACPACNRVAEYIETSPHGIAWYRCPVGHDQFMDTNKLMTPKETR